MTDSFDSFEKVRDFVYKCKHCGQEVPSGIVNISNHWAGCSGKEFYEALMRKSTQGFTMEDYNDLMAGEPDKFLARNK